MVAMKVLVKERRVQKAARKIESLEGKLFYNKIFICTSEEESEVLDNKKRD